MKTNFLVALREPGVLIHSFKAFVWVVAGIAVAVWLVTKGIHVFQVMRGGATTSARVIETYDDTREDSGGRRVGLVTVAEYEFSAQGARFSGATEGSQGSYSVGDSINIQYNPRNPAQNRAKGDRGELGNYFIMLLCGGLFSYYTITINLPLLRRLFADMETGRRV